MLNLQEIQNKTIDLVWVDGTFIKLNQPTFKMIQDMGEVGDDLGLMKKHICTMLNNNTSSKKFIGKDVDQLSKNALESLVKYITDFKEEVDNSPNA